MKKISFAMMLVVTLASSQAIAQYKVPGRMPGVTSQVDEDSAFAKTLKRDAIVKKGRMSSFMNVKVETRAGMTSLPKLSKALFKEQDDMATSLKRAPKALYGAIQSEEEVYETRHTYVLRRTITLPVRDPAAAKKASRAFREEFGAMSGTLEKKDLTRAQVKELTRIKGLISKLPKAHPLKAAAAGSDQDLLDALTRGVGEVSVSHSFVIPKVAPRLSKTTYKLPKVTAGAPDYSTLSEVPLPLKPLDPSKLQAKKMNVINRSTGEHEFSADFLNGFTVGYDFHWEKRWDVKYVGFFRLTVGAHAGFGIRIPIQVNGKIKPANIVHRDFKDKNDHFDVEMSAKTFDAPSAYYTKVGVPSYEIFNGNEAFASMGAGYGYKLYVFGADVIYHRYQEIQIGPRFDFAPLLTSSYQKVAEYFIPAALTKTGFNLGVLKGSVRIGAKLEAKGKIEARFSSFFRKQNTSNRMVTSSVTGTQWPSSELPPSSARTSHDFAFQNQNQKVHFTAHLPKQTQRGVYEYGIFLERLVYASTWAMTPGLRFDLDVGVDDWTFVDIQKDLWLDAFRIDLGTIDLDTHDGTPSTYELDSGRKHYQEPKPEEGDRA